MNHPGLTPMVKIEVVVTGEDLSLVQDLITSAGGSGYTVLSGVSGLGHHGFHQGRLQFNDRDVLQMLVTVLPPDRIDAVVEPLRELLADRPGVMFVTDTYVSRPEYFS